MKSPNISSPLPSQSSGLSRYTCGMAPVSGETMQQEDFGGAGGSLIFWLVDILYNQDYDDNTQ